MKSDSLRSFNEYPQHMFSWRIGEFQDKFSEEVCKIFIWIYLLMMMVVWCFMSLST